MPIELIDLDEEIRKQLEAMAMEDPMIKRAMKDWENVSAGRVPSVQVVG